MILLNNMKVNKNEIEKTENIEFSIEDYKKLNNFGLLKCPCCSSTELIRWGYYYRSVILLINTEVVCIHLSVQRVKCNSCNKTHAVMPMGIIPYKQHALDIIIEALIDSNNAPILENISLDTIDNWKKQLRKIISYLIVLFKEQSINNILLKIKNQLITFFKEYYQKYRKCFLQNKFLYLNMCSL